jgi:hypothetical protein
VLSAACDRALAWADVAYLLLTHENGQSALELAALEGMRTFLSQPAVRGAIDRLWLGEVLVRVKHAPSVRAVLEYAGLAACNLALLPLVAASPAAYAEPTAAFGWVRVFGNPSRFLLQVGWRRPQRDAAAAAAARLAARRGC